MPLSVGTKAPSFRLSNPRGETISLDGLLEKGPVVLYFYPKDETTGCTIEACTFRDTHEDFVDAGAQVVGVSSDDETSHRSFAENHRLPFELLSDPGGQTAKAYEVKKVLGLLPGRVTFVIDQQGVIRSVFDSATRFKGHVEHALDTVRSLQR